MDGYGRWGHDFKSRASTVPPSRLETVTSLIQPKVADHGFESRLPFHRKSVAQGYRQQDHQHVRG